MSLNKIMMTGTIVVLVIVGVGAAVKSNVPTMMILTIISLGIVGAIALRYTKFDDEDRIAGMTQAEYEEYMGFSRDNFIKELDLDGIDDITKEIIRADDVLYT